MYTRHSGRCYRLLALGLFFTLSTLGCADSRRTGEVAIPPQFDLAGDFSEGLAVVYFGNLQATAIMSDGYRYGFISKDGNLAISPKYSSAGSFHNGLATVREWKKHPSGRSVRTDPLLIDRRGQVKVTSSEGVKLAGDFHKGLIPFKDDFWKMGFLDKAGNVVIQPIYDHVFSFESGFAVVTIGRGDEARKGVLNSAGKIVVDFDRYDLLNCVREEFCTASKIDEEAEGIWLIDLSKKRKRLIQADVLWGVQDGLAAFGVGSPFREKWGFVDADGDVVIPPIYDRVGSFSEGLAFVAFGDIDSGFTGGYISKNGDFVIKPIFSGGGEFSNGKASVTFDGKDGIIDENGNFLLRPTYFWIGQQSEGLVRYQEKENGKFGYLFWE